MNHARRLTHVTLFAAVIAAGFTTVNPAHAGEAEVVRIIQLPPVTIVAKRAPAAPGVVMAKAATPAAPRIIELPPVVVVAKRQMPSTTLIAERRLRTSGA